MTGSDRPSAQRVTLRANGCVQGVVFRCPATMAALLKLADQRSLVGEGCSAKRLFTLQGGEIIEDDFDLVAQDEVLYVSGGEDWRAPAQPLHEAQQHSQTAQPSQLESPQPTSSAPTSSQQQSASPPSQQLRATPPPAAAEMRPPPPTLPTKPPRSVSEPGTPQTPLSLVGREVEIHSLKSKAELNGMRGVALNYNEETGRLNVEIRDGQVPPKTFALKQSNLALCTVGSASSPTSTPAMPASTPASGLPASMPASGPAGRSGADANKGRSSGASGTGQAAPPSATATGYIAAVAAEAAAKVARDAAEQRQRELKKQQKDAERAAEKVKRQQHQVRALRSVLLCLIASSAKAVFFARLPALPKRSLPFLCAEPRTCFACAATHALPHTR